MEHHLYLNLNGTYANSFPNLYKLLVFGWGPNLWAGISSPFSLSSALGVTSIWLELGYSSSSGGGIGWNVIIISFHSQCIVWYCHDFSSTSKISTDSKCSLLFHDRYSECLLMPTNFSVCLFYFFSDVNTVHAEESFTCCEWINDWKNPHDLSFIQVHIFSGIQTVVKLKLIGLKIKFIKSNVVCDPFNLNSI